MAKEAGWGGGGIVGGGVGVNERSKHLKQELQQMMLFLCFAADAACHWPKKKLLTVAAE